MMIEPSFEVTNRIAYFYISEEGCVSLGGVGVEVQYKSTKC